MLEKIKETLTFDKPCIILPHYGEFGWFIIRHIRVSHIVKCPHKVICCRKGDEIYFPNAQEFYYNWKNPQQDHLKNGYRDLRGNDIYEKHKLIENIQKKYPNSILLDLSPQNQIFKNVCNVDSLFEKIPKMVKRQLTIFKILKEVTFPLSCSSQKLSTDVVIGARQRAKSTRRNWLGWSKVANFLTENKIKYGVVGIKETTYPIENAAYYSWNFKNEEATINLINNCKIFIGADTGTTHIATFLKKPIILVWKRWPHWEKFVPKEYDYITKESDYIERMGIDANRQFKDCDIKIILDVFNKHKDK